MFQGSIVILDDQLNGIILSSFVSIDLLLYVDYFSLVVIVCVSAVVNVMWFQIRLFMWISVIGIK